MNDDLISRKETVRFIREKIRLSTFMQRSVDKADKACEELCERIEKEVPTIEPEREKTRWIPTKGNKLPKDKEMKLVTCCTKKGQRSVNRAYYADGFWHGSGSMSNVIAWMPMPEPYKEDKE